MIRNSGKGLEERVRRLEDEVEGHERALEGLRLCLAPPSEGTAPDRAETDPGAAVVDTSPQVVPAVSEPVAVEGALPENLWEPEENRVSEGAWRGFELPFELANLRRWEWWMNKVGIALLLMSVVFLFKFSWDRGWLQVILTPVVRVGLGIFLGSALVWVGLRVYAGRRAFAQVVLGGGIGTYYITGFAAFQMLGVFSYPVSFAFMAAVTLLASRWLCARTGPCWPSSGSPAASPHRSCSTTGRGPSVVSSSMPGSSLRGRWGSTSSRGGVRSC